MTGIRGGGAQRPEPDTCIDAADRGLHYGDGLFETIAVHKGIPVLLDDHLQRLDEGCRRLAIPLAGRDRLRARLVTHAASLKHGVLKLIVTRGTGGRGYRPPADPHPSRLISHHPFPDYPEVWWRDGVRARWCATRLGRNPALAGLKHLNRLEQVIARAEWSEDDIAEGLMRDSTGQVVEGTLSNLFVLDGQRLRTPPVDACGVAGVMRARLPALAARFGFEVQITPLDPTDLQRADALLLSNSLIGLWPVAELDGRRYAPRAFPRALIAAARALARGGEGAR